MLIPKVDTCAFASTNAIHTKTRVYDKCPANGGVVVANQSAAYEPCSVLTYDVHTPGSYWIVVRGLWFCFVGLGVGVW